MHQEILQTKEMCRQERQQNTLLQQKLHRALKALTGSNDSTSHSRSVNSTNIPNNVYGTIQKPGTTTLSSSHQKSRSSVETPSNEHHNTTTNHTQSVPHRSSVTSMTTNGTVGLQAALSPIRLLAHQLAQSGGVFPRCCCWCYCCCWLYPVISTPALLCIPSHLSILLYKPNQVDPFISSCLVANFYAFLPTHVTDTTNYIATSDNRDYHDYHHRRHRHRHSHHHESESASPKRSSSRQQQQRHRSPSSTTHHKSTLLQPQSSPPPHTQHPPSNNYIPIGRESSSAAAAVTTTPTAVSTAVPTITMMTTQMTPTDTPSVDYPPSFGAGVDVDAMGGSRTFLSSSPSFDTSSPSSSSSTSTSTSSPVFTSRVDPNSDTQVENTHTRAKATAVTSTHDIVLSSSASLPVVPPPPPPPMSALSLPPPGPYQSDTFPLNPTPPSQPQVTAAFSAAAAAAAAAAATTSSIPILVQIEQDIAQLDGEIEDLQRKLAQTVGMQAHQKMTDLLFRTTTSSS